MTVRIEPRYEVEPATGCWLWLLAVNNWGYGIEHIVRSPSTLAYLNSYVSKYGKVPEGKVLDHTCKNTLCINPDHLEPVTTAVNTQRGRVAKLDQRKVTTIYQLYLTGLFTYRNLAEAMGVSKGAIDKVLTGRSWKPKNRVS
jgi:hypothetical protein